MRIGVNWGSLDPELIARMMDENAAKTVPLDADLVMREGVDRVRARKRRQGRANRFAGNKIVLSCKVSAVQDLIAVYRSLAARCDYPLHLGLTEAGMGSKGIVASTAALSVLLQGRNWRHHPHFAHSRTERRSHQRSHRRAGNLQTMGFRSVHADGCGLPRVRSHHQHVFPGVGDKIQSYLRAQMPVWRNEFPAWKTCTWPSWAAWSMGRESKLADIGIRCLGPANGPWHRCTSTAKGRDTQRRSDRRGVSGARG